MINTIIAIILEKRNEDAPAVQEILTKHGCIIKVRLGVHEIEGCPNKGLIILISRGSKEEVDNLVNELNAQPRVNINLMNIN